MQDKIRLEKVKDDEHGERFWIVYTSAEKKAIKPGYQEGARGPMTEPQIRDFFEKAGQPEGDVEAMFQIARQTYRAA
jgi:hypothetical protein